MLSIVVCVFLSNILIVVCCLCGILFLSLYLSLRISCLLFCSVVKVIWLFLVNCCWCMMVCRLV